MPGGPTLRSLVALMRHYLGFEMEWDLQLGLKAAEVPQARLGGSTRLGWSTWIGSQARTRDANDLILDVESVVGRTEAVSP